MPQADAREPAGAVAGTGAMLPSNVIPRGGLLPDDVVAPLRGGAPLSRRQFMALGAAAAAAASLAACGGGGALGGDTGAGTGPAGPSGSPPTGVTISGNIIGIDLAVQSGLALTNGFLLINTFAKNVMVVNVGGGTFKALSSVCTHAGCSTNWTFGGGNFTCLCHGSQFSTAGAVVAGPAGSPLTPFAAVFNGTANTVTVTT